MTNDEKHEEMLRLSTDSEPVTPWTTIHVAAANARLADVSLTLDAVLASARADPPTAPYQWHGLTGPISELAIAHLSLARTVNSYYGRDGTPPGIYCDTVEPNAEVREWEWPEPRAIPETDPAGREMRNVFHAAAEAALDRCMLPANRKKGDRAGWVGAGIGLVAQWIDDAAAKLFRQVEGDGASWAEVEAQAADLVALASMAWDLARQERLRSTPSGRAELHATAQRDAAALLSAVAAERDALLVELAETKRRLNAALSSTAPNQ